MLSEDLNFSIQFKPGLRPEARVKMILEGDDFPTLDDIFTNIETAKRAKIQEEDLDERNKENAKLEQRNIQNKTEKEAKESDNEEECETDFHLESIQIDTPVFVYDHSKYQYVPGIVIENKDETNYAIKLYNGDILRTGRRFILCTNDTKFYSITPVSLKTILSSDKVLVRTFVRKNILKLVEDQKDTLTKILKGEVESERDLIFRSGKRFSLNSENSPGPFTLEEYNFYLEYFPDVLMPKILKDNSELLILLEKRFDKSGKALKHFLRQYSYLVLVPEFTVRHILNIDSSVKTLEEANEKLLNHSSAYDQETGNFINYLYSKQEMYKYARREQTSFITEADSKRDDSKEQKSEI